jgi:hypothetical protein
VSVVVVVEVEVVGVVLVVEDVVVELVEVEVEVVGWVELVDEVDVELVVVVAFVAQSVSDVEATFDTP